MVNVIYGGYEIPPHHDHLTDDYGELLKIIEHVWMRAPALGAPRAITNFILDRETTRRMANAEGKEQA